jgi:hypothetical protein
MHYHLIHFSRYNDYDYDYCDDDLKVNTEMKHLLKEWFIRMDLVGGEFALYGGSADAAAWRQYVK